MADSPPDADAGAFDPYHKWLGIPPKEQPPNHYRLLGIEAFEDDLEVIESAGNRQSAFLRQLALGPNMAASQQLLNEVSKAQVCLLRSKKKEVYDEKLRAQIEAENPPETDSATDGLAKPSLPDQLIASGRQAADYIKGLPRNYLIGGTTVVVLFVLFMLFGPVTVDPDGPAQFRVEVDEAFTKQFEEKLVYFELDETDFPIEELTSGIELEGGDHTLVVKVANMPQADESEEPPDVDELRDKLRNKANAVLTRKFPVVATEPPTLQLSFVEGAVTNALLLSLSDDEFELPGGFSDEAMVLKGDEKEYFTKVRPFASGRYMLTSSSNGLLRLWNLQAEKSIRNFRSGRYLYTFAVAPDGHSILANGDSTELRHISLETGQPVRSLEGHTAAPSSVAFAPDGKSATSAGGQGDGSVRMWDLESGNERWNYVRTGRAARDVRFSPDGAWVFAVVDDILVRMSAESGDQITMYDAITPYAPTGDSRGVLARGINSNFQIWNADSGLQVHEFEVKSSGALALSPNGQYAASVVPDRKETFIQVWNTTSGEEVAKFTGHEGDIYDVDFFPSGKFLASSGRDGTTRIWRLPELDPPAVGEPAATPASSAAESGNRLSRFRYAQTSAAASRTGHRVASIYYGGAKVWDTATGKLIFKTINHSAEHLAISQDGNYVVSASSLAVHVWDVADGRELNRIALPGMTLRGMSLSPDNRMALVSMRMEFVGPLTPVLIDLVTGGEVGRFPTTEQPAVLTGDGKHVVAIDGTEIKFYERHTGQLVQTLEGHEPYDRGAAITVPLAVSANGQVIASVGNADRILRVWGVDGRAMAAVPIEGSLSRVALSADGAFAYGNNNGLTIFDVASGTTRPHGDKEAQLGWLAAVSTAHDSVRRLLTMEGGDVTLWRLPDEASSELTEADSVPKPSTLDFEGYRDAIQQFTAHERDVRQIEFSGDGTTLLTASGNDKDVRFWDAATHEEKLVVDAQQGAVYAFALAKGEKSIVTVHSNGAIVETEIATRKASQWRQKHDLYVTSVEVSPDGTAMVSTAADGRGGVGNVRLWDINDGTQMWQYSLLNVGASSAGFSSNGEQILAAVDGTIRVLDRATGKPLSVFDGAGTPVARFAPQPADRLLTTDAGAMRLWNAVTGLEVRRFRGYSTQVATKSAMFSPDGRFAVSLLSGTPAVRIWNASSGRHVAQFGSQEDALSCMTFSPDGKSLAFGHANGGVTVWDLPDRVLNLAAFGMPAETDGAASDSLDVNKPVGEVGRILLAGSYAGVPHCTSDGQLLTAAHAGCAKVWNTRTGQLIFKSSNTGASRTVISADGKTLVSRNRYGLNHWDVTSGEKLGSFKIPEMAAFDFAPNGNHVAVVSRPKKKGPALIELRNIEDGSVVRAFGDGSGTPSSISFSPSGKFVAVIDDAAVRVFDVESGDQVTALMGHLKTVYRFAFSDDESQITSFSDDGTVRTWALDSGTEISQVRPGSQYVYLSGNGTCLATIESGLSLIDLNREPPPADPPVEDRPKTGLPIEIPDSNLQGSRMVGAHFLTGGTHVVTTAQDGVIRIWKLPALAAALVPTE